MNLFLITTIKDLLKKHEAKPLKNLGQNFLIDRQVAKKIIEAADLSPSDNVLEIGPGFGTLTSMLAPKIKKIIAIEKDPKMSEVLRETLKDFNNIEIIQADILKLDPKTYLLSPYKIVANLPYYITSPLIRKFLESIELSPTLITLMIQKEVAQRICAKPPNMSILAISVQFYAEAKIISYVSKKSFWPQPKVDSAIIKIKPQVKTNKKEINNDLFFKVVRAGFSQPRKQLINNLSKELKIDKMKTREWLLKNKIQPTQRAERLNVEDWIALSKNLLQFTNA